MARLLNPPTLKETGVGRVLSDIGCVALLSGIYFGLCLRRVLVDLGVVTGALVASIGGGHGWHFIVT
jgi:hypothetical protein